MFSRDVHVRGSNQFEQITLFFFLVSKTYVTCFMCTSGIKILFPPYDSYVSSVFDFQA